MPPPSPSSTAEQAAVPIVAVVGSTAVGKSDLAIGLAEHLGGEVVNTDAMQLYRGMDIGTAKVPPAERRGVPHHLLDVLDVTETATVAEFQTWARAVIADCRARGVVPILVGGSALYTRAVIDRFDFPGTDPALRERLDKEHEDLGAGVMHARLAELDPQAAASILASNRRRVVRALEVIELTGRPFTATLPRQEYVDEGTVQLGVDRPRPEIDARVEQRVHLMWQQGLLDEVRSLEQRGLRDGLTASRAIGYRQALDQLSGNLSEEAAMQETVRATRRFARRQESWFRKDPRVTWVSPEQAADGVEPLARSIRTCLM